MRQDCDRLGCRLGAAVGCEELWGAMAAAPSIAQTRYERGRAESGAAWRRRGEGGDRGKDPGNCPVVETVARVERRTVQVAAACALV